MDESRVISARRPGLAVPVLALVVFVPGISQSVFIPTLPAMSERLGSSLETTAWIVTAFIILASVGTPITGRLGVLFGRRRVMVALLAVYAAGSLLAALSDDVAGVIAGRVLQGCIGGTFSLAFATVADVTLPTRRRRGHALLSVVVGIATGAGFLLGGLAAEHGDPRVLFWAGVVLSLATLVAVLLVIPPVAGAASRQVDVLGGVLLATGLTLPLVAVSQANRWGWLDERTLALAAAGVALLVAWARVERRVPAPMLDLDALTPRPVWLANAATLLQGCGMFGLFVLTLQLCQQPVASGAGLGLGATAAGLVLVPGAALMLVVGPFSARLGERVGDHLMLAAGSGLAALGLVLLAFEHTSVPAVVGASVVASIGLGLAFPAMPALVSRTIETDRVAEAVSFNALMRGVGSAVGAQVGVAVLAGTVVAGSGLPSSAGYERAFLVSAALSALGALVAVAIEAPRPARRLTTSRR